VSNDCLHSTEAYGLPEDSEGEDWGDATKLRVSESLLITGHGGLANADGGVKSPRRSRRALSEG